MSVLLIILALTTSITNVSAKGYVADDNYTIPADYHEIFKNYFGEQKKYRYFPYKCGQAECYFGIDETYKYLDITFDDSYNVTYTAGIDKEFNVTGSNVFIHEVSSDTIILYALVFMFIYSVISMLRCWYVFKIL